MGVEACLLADLMRVLFSAASLFGWRISKIYVKYAFLQTGDAQCEVYVVFPRERDSRGKCLCIFLETAYGIINANAKWQVQYYQMLLEMGFTQDPLLRKLFCVIQDSRVSVYMHEDCL